ncbi:putative glycosyltransferase [Camellia lanceoleosa]|nr:putative glycosyltransferase [Camellia lanceoleosa]
MWLPKKPLWAPSLSYSITVSVLLLVTPLLVFSLVGCTLERRTIIYNKPRQGQKLSRQIKIYTRLERQEATLAKARSSIREAIPQNNNMKSNHTDPSRLLKAPSTVNANAFHRTKFNPKLNSTIFFYLEMEKLFKIYVYEEGEPPMFHNGPCRSIYSTEGRFIMEMENGNFYRTKDPEQALVFFLPFSVVMMYHAIGRAVVDYIDIVARRHPFWNRSLGADHFMLSCHDWGPHTTSYVPHLYNNSIRVLCNANTSEGFNPSKDVPLPEIHLRTGEITGLLGGPSPSHRPILAFFAGRLHGHIRHLLLNHWKEKDRDIQVYDNIPDGVSYESMLKNSRFCLCPSGYEVATHGRGRQSTRVCSAPFRWLCTAIQ